MGICSTKKKSFMNNSTQTVIKKITYYSPRYLFQKSKTKAKYRNIIRNLSNKKDNFVFPTSANFVAENSTSNPYSKNIAENSTSNPYSKNIAENSTSNPYSKNIAENSTSNPYSKSNPHTFEKEEQVQETLELEPESVSSLSEEEPKYSEYEFSSENQKDQNSSKNVILPDIATVLDTYTCVRL